MSLLTRNRDIVDSIIAEIELQLRNRQSFGRASADDRFDRIRIRGFLTVVPSYIFVEIEFGEEDLKDPKKIADDFVTEWCKCDSPENVRSFQQFVRDGERWGWD